MSRIYALVVAGAFTSIRYSEDALRFGTTIADITGRGDTILPVIGELTNEGTVSYPSFRAPSADELAHEVRSESDLAAPIYRREMGVAGGVATLGSNGDIPREQVADEFTEFLGTWDPLTNTPELVDGVGNIGNTYRVVDTIPNEDLSVNLGTPGEDIMVRPEMLVMYQDDGVSPGRWRVTSGAGLSSEDRFKLDNAMQKLKTYQLVCVPSEVQMGGSGVGFAQLESPNNAHPEFMLVDGGGFTGVTVNAHSGEVRIPGGGRPDGEYKVTVSVGGPLGQSDDFDVDVLVSDPGVPN